MKNYKKKYLFFMGLFVILVLLDRYSKYLADTYLQGRSIPIIKDVFELSYLRNSGAAWGILNGYTMLLSVITLVILVGVIFFIPHLNKFEGWKYTFVQILLVVLCAGAMGNLIDRIVNGYVIDYFYFKLIDFPVFNVADCYVTISVALLLLSLMFGFKEHEIDCIFKKRKEE